MSDNNKMEIVDLTDVVIEEVIDSENFIPITEDGNAIIPEDALKAKKAGKPKKDTVKRPDTVEAKVYKLKSRFVNENLYVTLSYVQDEEGNNRPIEIFINSKDLSKLPEYTVLTRLISAIFRHFNNPTFILEELQSIYDPNGGYFSKGRYVYSFYSEVAMIIEKFFIDIKFLKEKDEGLENWIENAKKNAPEKEFEVNNFKICSQCNQKSLQLDGGCLQCINPECGYSKCS
jgi:hypothetical protein